LAARPNVYSIVQIVPVGEKSGTASRFRPIVSDAGPRSIGLMLQEDAPDLADYRGLVLAQMAR
jgi:hypothetical protein